MSHQTPYINSSRFSKPPPNFNKKSSSKWNNFKVPTSPIANSNSKKTNPPNNTSRNYPTNSGSTSRNYDVTHSVNHSSSSPAHTRNYSNLQNYQSGSQNVQSHLGGSQNVQSQQNGSKNYTNSLPSAGRNYQTTPPPNIVRNYQNEPPQNYKIQSTNVSPERSYKDLVLNPMPAQQFKPNVPPPKIQKSIQSSHYKTNLKTNPAALQAQMLSATTLEEAKANYYRQMLYRYRQVADYSKSLLAYSPASIQPPPPPNYPPPQQPPLPPDAPPPNPPPPPSLASQSSSTESIMSMHNNYRNRPPSLSGSSTSSEPSSSSMSSNHNYQMQNQHPMGNYHSRMPPHQFNVHNSHFNKPMMQYNLKRKHEENVEQKKFYKKKKRPLSKVGPLKISWTTEEAQAALDVEMECNKRSRRQGLIIKFPDQELNRDIVTNFHTSIETVHFQQPSTPRYCFVSLVDSADPETVIRHINQIPFGLGYLTAEHKNDKQDEKTIRPCDIDPLTLYVGNLAQDITKDDIIKTYPKQKRIDIGYARKMKYTRYAFVSFYTVDDAIEAFKKTYSSQLHSKSLIVRFRRLHGTVGLPGETRVQLPARTPLENGTNNNINSWDIDVSHWDNEDVQTPEPRPLTEDEDEEEETKIQLYQRPGDYRTRFGPEDFDAPYTYLPRNVIIKEERNDEGVETNRYQDSDCGFSDHYDEIKSEAESPGLPDHYDETNSQTECSNTRLVTKQEQIKEEDYVPHSVPIRFRVIRDTINVRPSSENLQPNNSNTPIGSEPPLNDADNSTDDIVSVKREDESNLSAQKIGVQRVVPRNVEIQDIAANSLILPVPILIKTEQNDKSDDNNTHISAYLPPDLPVDACTPSRDGCEKRAASNDRPDVNSSAKESSDSPPVGGLEKSSERCDDSAENFDWDVGANFPIRDIKAELEFDDPAGDDNSSDEELDIHDILKKQKKGNKE
ncbi:unnamed protein product [Psylliodes chrysocephalus]|uniref:RRM domain-containing protein n=1 Tax=Psylliodes chrysocephalus TaxID=3402493 RepID=A0A9P0GCS5_9CUCU|nr:unnamed protein product [Psylliodes chrysocephala]